MSKQAPKVDPGVILLDGATGQKTADVPPEMVTNLKGALDGLGFERVQGIPGSSYRDNSTIVIVPSRGLLQTLADGRRGVIPLFHQKVVQAWQGLMGPMNQKRAFLYVVNSEVGDAYNQMIAQILQDPVLSKWKYVLTLEDDNLPPGDAHIRLLESIEWGPFDAVSGIYFTRGDYNMPMAYGDPEEFRRTGVLDMRPRDCREALSKGNVMPVNGIAMGCALWRLDLFRWVSPPWFVTVSDVIPEKGPQAYTQDLSFCEKARRAGKTFAVDFRVKVGHLDVQTGIVY